MKPFLVFCGFLFLFDSFGQNNVLKYNRSNSVFSDTGTTSSDYITYIEGSIQQLSVIRTSAKVGYKVLNIRSDLPETDTTITIIKESLKHGTQLDIRDLQMYQILIKDVQKKLVAYKVILDTVSIKVLNASGKMKVMRGDTIWKQLKQDTTARALFDLQLKELRKKWRYTDSTIKTNTKLLDQLTIQVTNNAIINAELLDQIDSQIIKLSRQSFTKEQYYLWEKKPRENSAQDAELAAEKYYRAQKEAITFYITENSGVRIVMFLVGVLFFLWVNRNFNSLRKLSNEDVLKDIQLTYLSKNPVFATLVFVLNLSPFFDLTPPAVYIAFMQFLLMLVLTWVFYKKWPMEVFVKWATIIILFLLLSSAHLISSSSAWLRYWFFALAIGSVVFGIFFFIEQIKTKEFPKYVSWVTLLYIIFNLLSIIANLSGRWTLAQLFGSSAVFGLAQIISLSVFIQTCIEAFTLNMQYARVKNGLTQQYNFDSFIDNIRKAFTFISIVLWVMVLASNLNIYNFLYDRILSFLIISRNIGSISFNIGSIILFFLIIWISGTLQKYISYLFGDTGEEISKVNKRQHSKLLLARLVLLTAGFLLAVAASGLPVDKITIILGALGVGIGLGLQNIVNNFVSGVILIFERPFQVGDSIEIGPRKGKVKEIGIRHSIILTPDGGEVIVPNGDMLSSQIMNWTLSNDYIRIEIPLKISATESWETVTDIVKQISESDERVLPTREPLVLLNSVNSSVIDFKVLVWCNDIHKAESLKSDLIELLFTKLKERNIEIK